MNFYKDKRWIKKRSTILRRDEYLCRECKRYGRSTQATLVHHVLPLEDYPEHKLNSANLISVCNKCHESFHNRLTDELTAKGFEWVERLKDKIKIN